MREYEVTVILKPGLDDETRTDLLERLEGWLTSGESDDDKPTVEFWGQRTLAYPIKKFSEGDYAHFSAKLDPSSISQIERNILYSDDVLRHLVVRKEG